MSLDNCFYSTVLENTVFGELAYKVTMSLMLQQCGITLVIDQ